VCRGASGSEAESLEREQVALHDLLQTEAGRNLIRGCVLQQRSRRLLHDSAVNPLPKSTKRAAVIGAGVMGAGIAQWISSRATPVVLQDIDNTRVAAGIQAIHKTYVGGVKRGLFSKHEAMRLIEGVSPMVGQVPLHQQDVVIEAAVENLDLKKKIFADLCERTRDDAILATNTSALPIGELAVAEGITNPGRILGLHFFNPVHRMKLVEVVIAEQTAPEAAEAALRFVRKIGKLPVIVSDSPGFLVNRILMPYLIAAGKLFDGGLDPHEIDEAMLDFGMPMGPLRLLDEIGLEVAMHVADTMQSSFGERLATPPILRKLVEHGYLGRKSGAGFFQYGKKKRKPGLHSEALDLRSSGRQNSIARTTISTFLAGLTVEEAKLCLEEKVVKSTNDIDFAMIMGTGWAPHRGGPMRYLETMGEAEFEERFEAARGVMADEAQM
ncbi:MAG: 3-hydroxyacyl-CoA dehydrogenase family protein, partial [Verrucomicrobiota bacterium]